MIVVDTSVVSGLMRPSPSPVVVGWVRSNERELYMTSITLAEICYGIERLTAGLPEADGMPSGRPSPGDRAASAADVVA
jgi:predicted nucleic acid-binding protein